MMGGNAELPMTVAELIAKLKEFLTPAFTSCGAIAAAAIARFS
jgi:hypothetical protein